MTVLIGNFNACRKEGFLMTYKSINPYNNELLHTYENATDADVETAIAQAHALYKDWRNDDVSSRRELLTKLADYFEAHEQELAEVLTKEMGKRIVEAKGEVALTAMIARYYADNAERILEPEPVETVMGDAQIISRPLGVILAVEPWNFPYYQIIRVFAPNFMAGNPVILKHAANTPGSADAFEKVVEAIGAPKGAFKNLFVTHDQIADILADNRVQGLAFTGSEAGGRILAKEAGANLKKSSLELGGNDAFIILDDTNFTELDKIIGQARLYNAGQVCTSSKRFIVTTKNYQKVLDLLIQKFTDVHVGDPLDPKTQLAPLSTVKAKQLLVDQVQKALDGGAKLAFGTIDTDLETAHFDPIILTNVTPDNPMYDTEFFGPVGQVYEVPDEAAAIKLANDSHYGLSGIVFSGDAKHGTEVASQIETGTVYVNSYGGTLPELIFGGVKNSGYGRELGEEGIKTFINQELIVTRTAPIDLDNAGGGFV